MRGKGRGVKKMGERRDELEKDENGAVGLGAVIAGRQMVKGKGGVDSLMFQSAMNRIWRGKIGKWVWGAGWDRDWDWAI